MRFAMIPLMILLAQAPMLAQPAPPLAVRSIVIRPHGFEPPRMNVRAGRVLIAVHNLSTLPDVFLEVSREGTLVHAAEIRRGRRATRQIFVLTAGTYVVSDRRIPRWSCRITVTP